MAAGGKCKNHIELQPCHESDCVHYRISLSMVTTRSPDGANKDVWGCGYAPCYIGNAIACVNHVVAIRSNCCDNEALGWKEIEKWLPVKFVVEHCIIKGSWLSWQIWTRKLWWFLNFHRTHYFFLSHWKRRIFDRVEKPRFKVVWLKQKCLELLEYIFFDITESCKGQDNKKHIWVECKILNITWKKKNTQSCTSLNQRFSVSLMAPPQRGAPIGKQVDSLLLNTARRQVALATAVQRCGWKLWIMTFCLL